MNEEMERSIREVYTRDMSNKSAVEKLVSLANRFVMSSNEAVEEIGLNVDKLGEIESGFRVVSSSEVSRYDNETKTLHLCSSDDPMAVDVAFGDAVFALSGFEVTDEKKQMVQNARVNCISADNAPKFSEYMSSLCDITNENRTKFDLGPIADIICSIFQYPVLTINGKKMVLPSKTKNPTYFDLQKGGVDFRKVLRDNVVNYMVLAANNRTTEIDILGELLGEEWASSMENELIKMAEKVKSTDIDMGGEEKSSKTM